jgi:hypothetical protein
MREGGDDDDGDDGDDEDDETILLSAHPRAEKGTITYSPCILGVRLRYRRHGKHVVT